MARIDGAGGKIVRTKLTQEPQRETETATSQNTAIDLTRVKSVRELLELEKLPVDPLHSCGVIPMEPYDVHDISRSTYRRPIWRLL